MKRRTVLAGLATAAGLPAYGLGSSRPVEAKPHRLVFEAADHDVLTTTIGNREVRYRFHRALPYVTRPADERVQSLNVSVPTRIDGRPVDTRDVPILFCCPAPGNLPWSVADARGVGAASAPTGTPRPPGNDPSRPMVSYAKPALAAGYVVVEPGARGGTPEAGQHATAAIADLKAAVRFVRFNAGRIPGDTDRIVSCGTGAGGALSVLLAASGDDPRYEPHLRVLGAADAGDGVFAGAAFGPISDLGHADMAYEWCWGTDDPVSRRMASAFAGYQASLGLSGRDGFGPLTAGRYRGYLLETYLRPAATRCLSGLSEPQRAAYLSAHPAVTWREGRAMFGWPEFRRDVGVPRRPAPEVHSGGEPGAPAALMNPMSLVRRGHPGRARHWWLRAGTHDTATSLTVAGNLAAALENLGDEVDARMCWGAGHDARHDAADLVRWIGRVSG